MAVEVTFYRLAPKPPASGHKAYAATAAGKVSRGRKWFRLEATPADVWLVSYGADVFNWLASLGPYESRQLLGEDVCCFLVDGEFYLLDSGLADIPNAYQARQYAIEQWKRGNPGWVVFLGDAR